jgi:hypothetical protein
MAPRAFWRKRSFWARLSQSLSGVDEVREDSSTHYNIRMAVNVFGEGVNDDVIVSTLDSGDGEKKCRRERRVPGT